MARCCCSSSLQKLLFPYYKNWNTNQLSTLQFIYGLGLLTIQKASAHKRTSRKAVFQVCGKKLDRFTFCTEQLLEMTSVSSAALFTVSYIIPKAVTDLVLYYCITSTPWSIFSHFNLEFSEPTLLQSPRSQGLGSADSKQPKSYPDTLPRATFQLD